MAKLSMNYELRWVYFRSVKNKLLNLFKLKTVDV